MNLNDFYWLILSFNNGGRPAFTTSTPIKKFLNFINVGAGREHTLDKLIIRR